MTCYEIFLFKKVYYGIVRNIQQKYAMSEQTIYQRIRKVGQSSNSTIRRTVRDIVNLDGLEIGHFIAFHEYRYCIRVLGKTLLPWYEIDSLSPLAEYQRKHYKDS